MDICHWLSKRSRIHASELPDCTDLSFPNAATRCNAHSRGCDRTASSRAAIVSSASGPQIFSELRGAQM